MVHIPFVLKIYHAVRLQARKSAWKFVNLWLRKQFPEFSCKKVYIFSQKPLDFWKARYYNKATN